MNCKICGKGESAGEHDPYTGIAKDGHKFTPDFTYGFSDRYVANQHKVGNH